MEQEETFDELIKSIIDWADQRKLIDEKNIDRQLIKVFEEVGELSSAVLKNDMLKILDGIGDSFVTLIILSAQLGLHPQVCLNVAYEEIKSRTGETKNGIFIKDNE